MSSEAKRRQDLGRAPKAQPPGPSAFCWVPSLCFYHFLMAHKNYGPINPPPTDKVVPYDPVTPLSLLLNIVLLGIKTSACEPLADKPHPKSKNSPVKQNVKELRPYFLVPL